MESIGHAAILARFELVILILQQALAERETRKLCEKLDDTLMLVGSEIWLADLSFYQTVRQAAKRDVPGADTIYDDLKERFPGVAGYPEEPTPTPTPPPLVRTAGHPPVSRYSQ